MAILWRNITSKKIKGVVLGYQIQDLQDRSRAFIVGVIKDIKFRTSKKGTRFAEVYVVDSGGNVQISVFEKDLPMIENAQQGVPLCLLCQAGEDNRDKSISLRLVGVYDFEEAQKQKVYPKFKTNDENSNNGESKSDFAPKGKSFVPQSADYTLFLPCNITYAQLKEIQNLALNNSGDERLVFEIKDSSGAYKMATNLKINAHFKSKVREIA